MFDSFWCTTNLKTAAMAPNDGAILRPYDPVTCTVSEDGRRQYTFWFSGGGETVRAEMQRTWTEMQCDAESWIRYARASLENRETLLGLMKRAEPITVIQRGGQTLLVPERAKPEIKKALLHKL